MNNPTSITTDKEPNREYWIDSLKGVVILLVIWGHTQLSPSSLNTWVQTFNVSTFLVISGILFAKNSKSLDTFKLTARKMMKPYIWFSIFAIIINIMLRLNYTNPGIYIFNDVYKSVTLYGIHALWYLPSYASATFFVLKAKNRLRRCIMSLIFIGVSIAFSYFAFCLEWNLGIGYYLILCPSSAIVRSFACAAMITIGYEMNNVLKEAKRYQLILLSILSLTVCIVFSGYTAGSNFSTVNYFPHPLILYLCAITGSFGLTSLFYLISGATSHMRFLRFCGKHSLILLVTHSTFRLTDLSDLIIHKLPGLSSLSFPYVLEGFIKLFLIMLMEIPVIYVFTQTPLKKIIS